MRFPTRSHATRIDWRPPLGCFVCKRNDDQVCEVVAHFRGEGYGNCLVLLHEVDGRPTTRVVTQSQWFGAGYIIVM